MPVESTVSRTLGVLGFSHLYILGLCYSAPTGEQILHPAVSGRCGNRPTPSCQWEVWQQTNIQLSVGGVATDQHPAVSGRCGNRPTPSYQWEVWQHSPSCQWEVWQQTNTQLSVGGVATFTQLSVGGVATFTQLSVGGVATFTQLSVGGVATDSCHLLFLQTLFLWCS